MNDKFSETGHTDDLLVIEISDEALEASATVESGAFTLGACTGLSVCPA
jgi:hypothetical protein